MKQRIFIFTTPLLLMFGCRRELTVQPNPIPTHSNPTPTSSYALCLFGILNGDTLFADGAQVSIDGKDPGVADNRGIFVTPPITAGQHRLSISQKLFSNYDSTIQFGQIHDIYCNLDVPLADFFPLKVGAAWVYRCYSSFYLEGAQTDPTYAGTGTITWTVLNSASDSSTDSYYCKGAFLPDSLTFYGWSSDISYFNVVDSLNHRITFSSAGNNSNWFMYDRLHELLITYQTLYRYQPANGPDSLVFSGVWGPFGSTYTIAVGKGIGIYRYEFKFVTPPSIYRYLWTLQQ